MHTLKRFIQYYRPYKTIFFLDLLCATFISIVDLLYPQFLRGAINGLFTESTDKILAALVPIGIGLFLMYVLQSLCKYYVSYQGHMMAPTWSGICGPGFLTTTRSYPSPTITRTIPDR